MIKLQEINFPIDCEIIMHEFHTYDPTISFNEIHNLKYLGEDLLQCSFPEDDLIIDLGWYGDVVSNQGEYKIQVIQNENWEIPFNVIYSKSAEEVKTIIHKILDYYTRIQVKTENDNLS